MEEISPSLRSLGLYATKTHLREEMSNLKRLTQLRHLLLQATPFPNNAVHEMVRPATSCCAVFRFGLLLRNLIAFLARFAARALLRWCRLSSSLRPLNWNESCGICTPASDCETYPSITSALLSCKKLREMYACVR